MGIGKIHSVILFVALAFCVYIALSPTLVYSPQTKVITFMFVALIPSILFGAEAASRFEMKLPTFMFTTGGAAAILFALLFVMDHLARPAVQISVFEIVGAQGQSVDLEKAKAFEVLPDPSGVSANAFIKGNQVVVIFPEQLPVVTVRIRPVSTDMPYEGQLSYAGSRSLRKQLGKDFVRNEP